MGEGEEGRIGGGEDWRRGSKKEMGEKNRETEEQKGGGRKEIVKVRKYGDWIKNGRDQMMTDTGQE
jgi:hypothetical protein